VIDEGHSQFAGMYAGAASDPKARQIAPRVPISFWTWAA
jgi:TPP-dependent 2-oxoacid decarboxylase